MCNGKTWLVLKEMEKLKPKDATEGQDVTEKKIQWSNINLGLYLSYGGTIHKNRNTGVEATFVILLGKRK